MSKTVWMISLALIVVIIGAVALKLDPPDRRNEAAGLVMVGARIDAPFIMVNQFGKRVSDQDFPGKYRLMFFGFTYCPAVCPTEMQKIAEVLQQLGPQADRIVPLFVTLDPQRDGPDVLKSYLEQFDKRIIGLVGPLRDIEKLAAAYKVYFRKVGEGPDYTIDHSAFIYLVSPQNDLVGIYRTDQTADDILKDLQNRLKP